MRKPGGTGDELEGDRLESEDVTRDLGVQSLNTIFREVGPSVAWTGLIDLRSLVGHLQGSTLEPKPLRAASSCLLSWCPNLAQPQQRYHLALLIQSHGPQVSLSRELGLGTGLTVSHGLWPSPLLPLQPLAPGPPALRELVGIQLSCDKRVRASGDTPQSLVSPESYLGWQCYRKRLGDIRETPVRVESTHLLPGTLGSMVAPENNKFPLDVCQMNELVNE